MSNFVILTPRKPVWGEPCNGCGVCCQSSACQIAQEISGDPPMTPCSLLEWDSAQYRCGAIRMASKISAESATFLAWKLGIGFGCDSEVTREDTAARMAFEVNAA